MTAIRAGSKLPLYVRYIRDEDDSPYADMQVTCDIVALNPYEMIAQAVPMEYQPDTGGHFVNEATNMPDRAHVHVTYFVANEDGDVLYHEAEERFSREVVLLASGPSLIATILESEESLIGEIPN